MHKEPLIGLACLLFSCHQIIPTQEPISHQDIDAQLDQRIKILVSNLGDDIVGIREGATNEIIRIGHPALERIAVATMSDDAEVRRRARTIKMALAIRERVSFSAALMKWYPDIYRDLATDDHNLKFDVLQIITGKEHYKILHDVTGKDIAGVIGELLCNNGKDLSQCQKKIICAVSAGLIYTYDGIDEDGVPYKIHGGWNRRIPATAPHITKLLGDNDEDVLGSAISALGENHAKEAVSGIRQHLNDESIQIRRRAVAALGKIGAREVIPEIVRLLRDESWHVRESAVIALGDVCATESILEIKMMLSDEHQDVRRGAIFTLANIGAREAIPEITNLINEPNWYIVSAAVSALGKLGVTEMIPEIRNLLNHDTVYVRAAAISTLADLGAREAIFEIKDLLKSNHIVIRRRAISALAKLGAREALPEIREFLTDNESYIRSAAVLAIGELEAIDLIPDIKRLLDDEDWGVTASACVALIELGDRESVSSEKIKLMKGLLRWDESNRQRIISALQKFGVSDEEIDAVEICQ